MKSSKICPLTGIRRQFVQRWVDGPNDGIKITEQEKVNCTHMKVIGDDIRRIRTTAPETGADCC